MSFGEKIKNLRKSLGLSQEQLAETVGVSRQAISKWETNQSSPDIDKITLLCEIFSITADELLGTSITTNKENKLQDYSKLNFMKRLFTLGWVTSLIGVILLILEYFSLYLLQAIEKNLFSQFCQNVLHYAKQPPMSYIFFITFVFIFVGLIVSVYSFIKYKK